MTYIKKLVMHGFKSFVRKTEIPFTGGINVILGPNGSGKSNISDALCFVLGRLSIKSMRAAKAGNLIFLGTKAVPPAKEAIVEIVFDNSNKSFSIDTDEISLKRIVRRNGQSIYKINNETKTRQEVLGLLAQAGIDPNGFNIILQGEIQNFVRMRLEDRRKIIEEVSGISIYEMRKEKSLKELEKTEEKLKEVSSILRERTAYLNNLEKERQQALRFKRLEGDVKKYKASIIYCDLAKNKKQIEFVNSEISKKNKEIGEVKKSILEIKSLIANLESKIKSINSTIQRSTGFEQEKLNREIADIRAELAGMNVKSENYENKLSSALNQKNELREIVSNSETEINELQKSGSEGSKTARLVKLKNIEKKKQELESLEEQRKKFYMSKSELKSIRERFQDKTSILQTYNNESEFLLKQIKSLSNELFDKKLDIKKLEELKSLLNEKKQLLENMNKRERELEKESFADESEIDRQNKLIEKISKMEICPLCKSKITKEHMVSIKQETLPLLEHLKKEIKDADSELSSIYKKKEILKQDFEQMTLEISKREADLIIFSSIEDKKEQIKTIQQKINILKGELSELAKIKTNLEKGFDENLNVEEKCEKIRIEIQELSFDTKIDVSAEVSFKQRELERSKISLKQISREEIELGGEIKEIKQAIKTKEVLLETKKKQEEELTKKFHLLISERDSLQEKIHENERAVMSKQNLVQNIEQGTNDLKIEKAKFDAVVENLEMEMLEFSNVEIIKTNKESLVERLNSTQETLSKIGSVNLRSLETYDSIKKEYDSINEKAEIISKEKEGVLKIIHEIDIKKKKTFLKTMDSLNEIFSERFSQLSSKGRVSLELENKKEPFEGGVGILVKTGHGKYFEVTSLSGGEQTLVALSLIFAIQEYKPYYFYILDEIDAALDKRNSERLADLLKKYMQKGQYIVITHNDEVITNATNLFGISMHDGVSKIISLKV